MRHGLRKSEDVKHDGDGVQSIPGPSLGCYFCNDVVAPGDVSTFVIPFSTKLQYLLARDIQENYYTLHEFGSWKEGGVIIDASMGRQ